MNRDRENLKAGLFVLVGGILAVAVIFVLADFGQWFEQKQAVHVYFQLSDGLHGLKEGAPVTLGDQIVGEVTGIRDEITTSDAGAMRVVGKVVTAWVPKRYDIYQDAVIELKAPLIGSGTSLNIRNVGRGSLHEGDRPIVGGIAGSEQVRELVREAGVQEQQRQQIRSTIASIESIAATLRDNLPAMVQTATEMLADGRTATDQLKQTVTQVRQVVTGVTDRYAVWLDHIDRVSGSADQSFDKLNRLIQDKDTQLRDTLDKVHHLAQVANDKTMIQLTEALDRAGNVLSDLKTASAELKTLVVGQRSVVERALANTQLTSAQMKLAAIEVRRSPWRLLYKPDEVELNTDNIYDSARSFALAAGALDTTAESLRAVVESQAVEGPRLAKIVEYLEAVFLKFKDAENAFWDAASSKPSAP